MTGPVVEETGVAHGTVVRLDHRETAFAAIQVASRDLHVLVTAAAYGPVEGGLQRESTARIEHVVKMAARDLDCVRRWTWIALIGHRPLRITESRSSPHADPAVIPRLP